MNFMNRTDKINIAILILSIVNLFVAGSDASVGLKGFAAFLAIISLCNIFMTLIGLFYKPK